MEHVDKAILGILKQLFEKTGIKHDAHFTEGVGAQFVQEYKPLINTNIILSVDERKLQFMQTTGQELNIRVE